MSAEQPIDGSATTKDMPAVGPRPASQPADRYDRRIYVWWGVLLGLLVLVGAFCWFFVRPYREVRAAVGRISAGRCSVADAVKALGGPEKAAAKCSLYIRCPKWLVAEAGDGEAYDVEILAACGPPAFPWAESLLHSRNERARAYAAATLGCLEDPRAVEPLIGALKDSEANVRRLTVEALGNSKDPRAVEPLIGTLKDSDDSVRCSAARALGWLNDRRAVEPLIGVLKDSYGDTRSSAAQALGRLKDPRATRPLKELLADPNASIFEAAEAAIREINAAEALKKIRGEEPPK